VAAETLRRVHECVFEVLALERDWSIPGSDSLFLPGYAMVETKQIAVGIMQKSCAQPPFGMILRLAGKLHVF